MHVHLCVFFYWGGGGGKQHTHTCVRILSSEEVGSYLQGFGLHLDSRLNRMVTLIHKMNMCLVSTILHNYVRVSYQHGSHVINGVVLKTQKHTDLEFISYLVGSVSIQHCNKGEH